MHGQTNDQRGDGGDCGWGLGVCDCGFGTRDCSGQVAPLSREQRVARLGAGAVMLLAVPLLKGLPASARRPVRVVAGWFGAAHVVAGITSYAGCPEVGAIPSLVLRRRIETRCGPWKRIDSALGLRSSADVRKIEARRLARSA